MPVESSFVISLADGEYGYLYWASVAVQAAVCHQRSAVPKFSVSVMAEKREVNSFASSIVGLTFFRLRHLEYFGDCYFESASIFGSSAETL